MGFGEKIKKNALSFTSAVKLETQKGIRKSLKVGQKPSLRSLPAAAVLRYNAKPMIRLNPKEVSHKRGLGSKYRASTTQYQMK